MKGLENLTPEVAADLIELVNSLKNIQKKGTVEYNHFNEKKDKWETTKYKYTQLDTILEKIKENKNFAFLQPICSEDEKVGIKCILIHKSGVYLISDLYELKGKSQKLKDEGAEITYRKRYAVGSFFGIATEDDSVAEDIEIKIEKKSQPMTKDQLNTIAKLEPELQETLRNFYKKDPLTLTREEAEVSINSMKEKGLLKSKEEKELEEKNKKEVF